MTLGDIWTAAAVELGIRSDIPGEKQTLITRVANSGILEILKRTKVRVVYATTPVVAGVGDYDLPSEVLRVTQLLAPTNSGGLGPVEQLSAEEIDWRRRAQSAYAGSPLLAYAVDGFNLLKIHPVPTASYELSLYYVARPAAKLAAAGDDPAQLAFGGIPEEYHEDVLLNYVYWKGGSQGDDQSSAQGGRYDQAFEAALQELRRRITRRKGRLGPARTAYSRRRIPSRNDTA